MAKKEKKHMARYKFLLATLFLVVIVGTFYFLSNEKLASPDPILQANGEVTDNVVRLLGWSGIRVENDPLPADPRWPTPKLKIASRSLEDVVMATNGDFNPQVAWNRNAGNKHIERWEMTGDFTPEQRENILAIYFDKMRLGKVNNPQKKTYKGILFLGAALGRVRLRLSTLNHLIDQYTLKGPVYLLTGERALSEAVGETPKNLVASDSLPIKANWSASSDLPNDEGPMIKLVFDQSKHPTLNDHDIIMVYASKRPGEARTTRADTVEQWLKQTHPEDGDYLAISNQPYNLNQLLVINRVLLSHGRSGIKVDVAGDGLTTQEIQAYNKPEKVAVLLDNLNRILFELKAIKALEKNMIELSPTFKSETKT